MNFPSASAARLSTDQLREQVSCIARNELLTQAFDAVAALVLVINQQRQILFSNKAFQKLLNITSNVSLIGKRPGEALECIHARTTEDGCGTSESCKHCGAVSTILKAMHSEKEATGEVIVRTRGGNVEIPYNLLESVQPFTLEENLFYIVSLQDISDAKRRMEFEQVFFHDIINVTGGLSGLMAILKEEVPSELKPDMELASSAFSSLVEEIMFHRKLLEAEGSNLHCEFARLNSNDIVKSVVRIYDNHPVRHRKAIAFEECPAAVFYSDEMLLRKVLGNLLKNALEATPLEGTVRVGCHRDASGIEFWVCNDGVIPQGVQHRIFQRSFSTKGVGRGIGTYSVKLFAEKYLHGEVSFVSTEELGTRFSVKLPVKPSVI